jgi:Fe-Mn family superoxide dismutase
MNTPGEFRKLLEKVSAEIEVKQIKLPVKSDQLSPVLSKENIDLHYGILYKRYVEKAHAGEGEFQVAGAKLHTLFFEQFQIPKNSNNPTGEIKTLIDTKFGSFDKFKDSIKEEALGIHGSGWVYLTKSGSIQTIQNHKILTNVAVIIDMWEHAFLTDYGSDKEKYLKNIWKIINWDIINTRLN